MVVAERRANGRLQATVLASVAALSAAAAWWAQPVEADDAAKATGALRGNVQVSFQGKPKADRSGVVVYLVGFVEPPPPAMPTLRQKGKAFEPPVLAITAGQSVSFPNVDTFFHNVFSLSPARSFDLGQYKNGEAKDKVFPKAGVVEVYCNIHPQMAATVLVLPNRRHAVTDAQGHFAIDGIPPGQWTLFAYDRFAKAPIKQPVTVAAGGVVELKLALDEVRADVPHLNKYGQPYREGGSGGGYP